MIKVDLHDVGQGDCSVIHLSQDEVIIVDVGDIHSTLPEWLNRNPKVKIRSIILTHNDADHVGCMVDVLDKCIDRIEEVCLIYDRHRGKAKNVDLMIKKIVSLEKQGKLKTRWLGSNPNPQSLYHDAEREVTLFCLHPSASALFDNLTKSSPRPNWVSAILSLSIKGKTHIVWAGDAPMSAVSQFCEGLKPKVIVGPHHGAPVMERAKPLNDWFEDPAPENVFISVGSYNKYSHPNKSFIKKHIAEGRCVFCSELYHCDNKRKQQGRNVISHHELLGMVLPKSKVASCRGAVQLTWNEARSQFEFDRFHKRHQQLIRELENPLCLQS